MNRKRINTTLRLLSHWSLGAIIGSAITTNNINNYATTFIIIYIIVQLIGIEFKVEYKRTISSKG